MDLPRKISRGEDIREALDADNVNRIIDLAAKGAGVQVQDAPQGVADGSKLSLARRQTYVGLDWVSVTISAPAENDIVPIGLTIPGGKRVVGFVGSVGEAVVSLIGTGFSTGSAPAEFANKTGNFNVFLGAATGTILNPDDMSTVVPSTSKLYLKVVSVPEESVPIHMQVIFAP